MPTAATWATVALLASTGAASAFDLVVRVEGLRSREGMVRVAVCTEATFTRPDCPWRGAARASAGSVRVTGIPPGTYAVQAFHDEDSDGDLDRGGFLPTEGLAFSRDAPMIMGPPRFRDAAFGLRGDGNISVRMRYFQ